MSLNICNSKIAALLIYTSLVSPQQSFANDIFDILILGGQIKDALGHPGVEKSQKQEAQKQGCKRVFIAPKDGSVFGSSEIMCEQKIEKK